MKSPEVTRPPATQPLEVLKHETLGREIRRIRLFTKVIAFMFVLYGCDRIACRAHANVMIQEQCRRGMSDALSYDAISNRLVNCPHTSHASRMKICSGCCEL